MIAPAQDLSMYRSLNPLNSHHFFLRRLLSFYFGYYFVTIQNKSRANPIGDLYAIQNELANSVITRFYETGHSFMPPDQNAGVINRKLEKFAGNIESPDEAFALMAKARRVHSAFEVVRLNF